MAASDSAWLASSGGLQSSLWVRGGKRAFDACAAALLLALLSPVLAVVCSAVALSSRGGVIYRQARIGRGGTPFTMYKIRTMRVDASEQLHRDYVRRMLVDDQLAAEGNGLFKLANDPRITRVGSVLRRTSLDELPQLMNVLLGQMSLVGPRPALPYEAELFPSEAAPRFSVRPGITGLWQVSGRNRLSMRAGLELDVEYVHRQSARTDLAILARTLVAVCRPGCAL